MGALKVSVIYIYIYIDNNNNNSNNNHCILGFFFNNFFIPLQLIVLYFTLFLFKFLDILVSNCGFLLWTHILNTLKNR